MSIFRVTSTPEDFATQRLAEAAGLRSEAQNMIRADRTIADALDRLAAACLFVDGIRLLAHSMAIRDLAWWGILGCWHSRSFHRDVHEILLLSKMLPWIFEPSPEAAANVKEAVAAVPLDRDIHQIARMIVMADDEGAARKAGVCGLFLNSAQRRQKGRDEFYADLLAIGRSIANEPRHWMREP